VQNTLVATGFPTDTTETEVGNFFEWFGPVVSVRKFHDLLPPNRNDPKQLPPGVGSSREGTSRSALGDKQSGFRISFADANFCAVVSNVMDLHFPTHHEEETKRLAIFSCEAINGWRARNGLSFQ